MRVREHFDSERTAEQHVFDDNFWALSFHADDSERLQSIELALRHEGKSYVLSIETWPIHMQRKALEEEGEGSSQDDQVYVLAKEEILPSDLLVLKNKPFEELMPYLVLQEPGE
jgi:hypothetical protein